VKILADHALRPWNRKSQEQLICAVYLARGAKGAETKASGKCNRLLGVHVQFLKMIVEKKPLHPWLSTIFSCRDAFGRYPLTHSQWYLWCCCSKSNRWSWRCHIWWRTMITRASANIAL
jgi:hypothetical protein